VQLAGDKIFYTAGNVYVKIGYRQGIKYLGESKQRFNKFVK
jgi:hypothetical protein